MARIDSSSLTSPQPTGVSPDQNGPPIAQQPRPIALTVMPDRPNFLEMVVSVVPMDVFS
jgi:hypothetical protein